MMAPIFADAYFYLALLNRDDSAHAQAVAISRARSGLVVTTAWVLTEVADALCSPRHRGTFQTLYDSIRVDPYSEIVPPSPELFDRGIDLYSRRPDKAWSLTDCISVVVMTDRGLTEALTGDHHFQQAGFRVLFRSPA
jgi:predicted nucleic acid-binding protein